MVIERKKFNSQKGELIIKKKLKKITTIILAMVTFVPAITSSAYANMKIDSIQVKSIQDDWNQFCVGNTEYAANAQLRGLFMSRWKRMKDSILTQQIPI